MKNKPKILPKTEKEENKGTPYYTYTKYHGWRINGYLKAGVNEK